MPNTIQTVLAAGYTGGIAQGDVQVEQDALAAAQQAAGVDAVTADANAITTSTVQDLANAGKLPQTDSQKQALVAQIASRALEIVQSARDERVAFHERAVAIAQAMPDVWRVEQHAPNLAGDQVCVLSMMVACKSDGTGWDAHQQAILDALADMAAFKERVYQALHHHPSTAPADDPAVLACPICNPPKTV